MIIYDNKTNHNQIMSRMMCKCQLPKNFSDYVYAKLDPNNKALNFEQNTIFISPKSDLHVDFSLNIELPSCIVECCEGAYEYDENIDIDQVMKKLGIEYSYILHDLWNETSYTNEKCNCDACNKKFPNLIFVNDPNIELCENGYRHISKA
jgi:hypothetical protein